MEKRDKEEIAGKSERRRVGGQGDEGGGLATETERKSEGLERGQRDT